MGRGSGLRRAWITHQVVTERDHLSVAIQRIDVHKRLVESVRVLRDVSLCGLFGQAGGDKPPIVLGGSALAPAGQMVIVDAIQRVRSACVVLGP